MWGLCSPVLQSDVEMRGTCECIVSHFPDGFTTSDTESECDPLWLCVYIWRIADTFFTLNIDFGRVKPFLNFSFLGQ